MANLQFSSEILNHGLFRSDEATDGTSDYDAQALIYLNQAYRSLYMGGNEFDVNSNEIWWWLKATDNIIMQSSIKVGTVSVTLNNAAATLSISQSVDLADGWYFKATDHADVFQISAHSGTQLTLDSVYTGDTDTAAEYRLMKLEYDLSSATLKPIDKMRSFQDSFYKVEGIAESSFDDFYPLNLTESGVPDRFTMMGETRVRFNTYGSDTADELIRLDYDFLTRPADLTDSDSEEPLVPKQYRHILSTMIAYYLMVEKDDDRATLLFTEARRGIMAMRKENRSRWVMIGEMGQIYPRPHLLNQFNRPKRTESGLILSGK